MSFGTKSPLTFGIKESNAGGTSAQMFAKMGIKALIIEGMPKDLDKWYSLAVTVDGVTISEETELIGKGNFAVVEALQARLGKKIGVITLGPAGEMKMLTANISVKDPESHLRSHGRGGVGAVMGSKKLKFISIDDKGAPGCKIADPEKFKTASKAFSKALVDHPVSGQGLPTYGTNVLVNILNEAGGLPTRNFTYGQYEFHDKVSGEFMHDRIVERGGKPKHGCHAGCLIQCSQIYNDKDGKYLTSGFEYETVWALGANAMCQELDDIAEADNIMDDLGMDSIETSVMFAVAMEAGILPWGDGRGVVRLLKEEIGKGTPLGRILGGGTEHVGITYGRRAFRLSSTRAFRPMILVRSRASASPMPPAPWAPITPPVTRLPPTFWALAATWIRSRRMARLIFPATCRSPLPPWIPPVCASSSPSLRWTSPNVCRR